MTSTSKNKFSYNFLIGVFIAFIFIATASKVFAQASLALSVSPTLFEMSANPGQLWQSSVKVTNSNPYEITVYPSVVNFAPQGEFGQGKFLPVFESMTGGQTLAEWFDISVTGVTIKPETSAQVPFTVKVPDDASPGGHFAAILISTQPPKNTAGSLAVRTSQVVTSLFFVRIAGDVIENGSIRSFAAKNSFSQTPTAELELRFENKGNVHLQPRGGIKILNMWGKERGSIPINHQTHFGNVLPESIRNFTFSWSGEVSVTDIGRYKAIASLGYGEGSKQFATAATYFWVIPIKAVVITILSLLAVLFVIILSIKLYVRKMLYIAGVDPRRQHLRTAPRVEHDHDVQVANYQTISGPVRSGYRDLIARMTGASALRDKLKALIQFLHAYKIFFSLSILLVISILVVLYFVQDVTEDAKDFDVTITNPGITTNLSAEEILYSEISNGASISNNLSDSDQTFTLTVVNTSGTPGTASGAALTLADLGYQVTSLEADVSRVDKKSTIVFDISVQEEALALSKKLGGVLLSARPELGASSSTPNVTLFTGKDRIVE